MNRHLVLLGALVAVLAAMPMPGSAELIRLDVAPAEESGVPRSFDQVRRLLEGAGLYVSWADQPYYQPAFAHGSGASYASLAVTWGADTVQVTWYAFDDPTAAGLFVADSTGARYYGDPTVTRVDGAYIVETYSYNYDPVASAAVMDIVGGAR
jgi:hypothetical protein